jgi:hypothetical protein
MTKAQKGIIWTILIALVVRIVLIWFAIGWREHPDILRWKDWSQITFLHGFADTYTTAHLSFGTYPNNMPPGTLYVVSTMYWFWLQVGKLLAHVGISPGSNAWINVVLLTIFLRIPSILADLVIGIFVYKIVLSLRSAGWRSSNLNNNEPLTITSLSKTPPRNDTRKKFAILAAMFFLFNPAVLFNSSIWGQMDSINNMFFIISLYFLLKKKLVWSAIFFVISLLVKSSLFIFIPLYIILFWRKKWLYIIMIVTMLIGVLPVSRDPFWYLQYVQKNATGEMTNISAFALNFWWVIYHPTILFGGASYDLIKVVEISLKNSPLTQTLYGFLSLGTLSYGASIFVQIPIYIWFIKKIDVLKKNFHIHPSNSIYLCIVFSVIAILSYLFLPQMHERYLYPLWAPLSILVGLGFPFVYELATLQLLNFINLLIVWHPMPLPTFWFDIMRNTWFQWWIAVFTLLVGLYAVGKICKSPSNYE